MTTPHNKILVFDTETTGRPPLQPGTVYSQGFFNARSNPNEWPRIVQLSYILYNTETMKIEEITVINQDIVKLKPHQYPIPAEAVSIHKITDTISREKGLPIETIINDFIDVYNKSTLIVGHNVQFDINVVCAELSLIIHNPDPTYAILHKNLKEKCIPVYRKLLSDYRSEHKFCTMIQSKDFCRLTKYRYENNGELMVDGNGKSVIDTDIDAKTNKQKTKNPRLEEAHRVCFGQKTMGVLHNALVDVAVCLRVYMYIVHKIDICKIPDFHTPSFPLTTFAELGRSPTPNVPYGSGSLHTEIIRDIINPAMLDKNDVIPSRLDSFCLQSENVVERPVCEVSAVMKSENLVKEVGERVNSGTLVKEFEVVRRSLRILNRARLA